MTDNSAGGSSDTCTACTAQVGCGTSGSGCSTVAGHTATLECLLASTGYFVSSGVMYPCSDMSAVVSVASCQVCTDASFAGCSDGTCARGYHTYTSSAQSCSMCTTVANAAVWATYTCTTALDSQLSDCASGYFRNSSAAADVCTPCTTVANAAAGATYTCTTALDSRLSACASGEARSSTGLVIWRANRAVLGMVCGSITGPRIRVV